jgi:acyl carrier protein
MTSPDFDPDHPVTLELAVAAVREVVDAKYETAIDVTAESRFEELGLDSTDFAVGFIVLEDIAGVELDPESAVDLFCVADLTRIRAGSALAAD